MSQTEAERLVDEKRHHEQWIHQIEGWMASYRLGYIPVVKRRPLTWKQRVEQFLAADLYIDKASLHGREYDKLPDLVAREFYDHLRIRLRAHKDSLAEVEKRLSGLTVGHYGSEK